MDDKERMFDGDSDAADPEQEESEKPEGGWGWVVCCGTFSVNFIVFGIHNSFGVVYEYLVDELHNGEAEAGRILIREITPKFDMFGGEPGKLSRVHQVKVYR